MKKMKPYFMAVILCTVILGACTPTVNTRGNLIPDSKIQQVQPNVTTQYDVAQLWGPPTFVAPFEDSQTWYYTGHTSERMGVFKYEITDRKLLQVDFDENGLVTHVQELDPELAQNVNFVNRETPTAGKDFTVLQQFVGNIGRFNAGGQNMGARQAGSR